MVRRGELKLDAKSDPQGVILRTRIDPISLRFTRFSSASIWRNLADMIVGGAEKWIENLNKK